MIDRRSVALAVAVVIGIGLGSWVLPGTGSAGTPSGATANRQAIDEAGRGAWRAASPEAPRPTLVPTPTPTPAPEPLAARPRSAFGVPGEPVPVVVRFRPRHGWSDVARSAELSVRFSVPMDPAATEAAFRAVTAGAAIDGALRWAEDGTVLVLRPAATLPYGARVQLLVEATARSAAGVPLAAPRSVAFTVVPEPPQPPPRPVLPAPLTSATGWQWPLLGPITQYFGQELTQYGVHQGLDIDGDTGDPVVAARAGRVVIAGYADECGGLQVRIDHGGGVLSWYRHLSRIDTPVGATVAAGTRVGSVGSTGCSTGSHLHFGVSVGGTFVDPLGYLPPR